VTHRSELLKRYEHLENQINIIECSEKYANLVRANGNGHFPVQRWFHQKEAFSLELLETLIIDWNISPETIHRLLDPFSGTGTSLLATQKLAKKYNRSDLEAFGIERNPFLHFVAQTKLNWYEYDPRRVKLLANRLLCNPRKSRPDFIPAMSTLHRRDILDPSVLKQALVFKEVIVSANCKERDLLLLGYASILEAISGARKGGRGLRIVPDKKRARILTTLDSAWDEIVEDLRCASNFFTPVTTKVFSGDGRTLSTEDDSGAKIGKFDLILYSPPYLNNIDYTEVYKLELWLCGFVNTTEEFRNLRYETFRSHPSVRFPDQTSINTDKRMKKVWSTIELLVRALPRDKNLNWRTRLFKSYFDDMYVSLKHQMDVLVPGGWIFCVVGNSSHGPRDHPRTRVPVASDLLIAMIAESLGLEIKAIQIARRLGQHSSSAKFLRESILVMQKT
jgi:DNA modification methylase